MYLTRKIDKFLEEWYSNKEKLPLIIRGARQVGKTEAVRHFAKGKYKSFIEINFVEQPQFKGIIEEGFNVDSIVKLISRINPEFRFLPKETLIFFDELQEFPEIATALKFFQQDGKFDIICSGSLLGIQYARIESNSVGYKIDYTMRSLDFEEFLWAIGYPNDIAEDMLAHLINIKPFTELELDKYFSVFMDYIILGGMPAVVKNFIQTKTFERAIQLQGQLLLDYQEDIQKYASGLDKAKILSVFNHIVPQLSKENKKFQFSQIAKGARSREYFGCIQWLLDAGVISISYCLNFPELPLKGNYDERKFKLYIADTGLLMALLDEEAREDLRKNKNLGIYKGALYENFVAEALLKSGFDLYYYKSENSTLEEDFFVRSSQNLLPVEVKSNNSSTKTLRALISSERYPDIIEGIKLVRGNIGKANNITTIPYFCTFLLKRYLKQLDSLLKQ
ncbi:MAG: ATP-binding protein [Kiritimatiellae bacterium]|nr:ATP-binding protein [Kiritimatiellia bacterium]